MWSDRVSLPHGAQPREVAPAPSWIPARTVASAAEWRRPGDASRCLPDSSTGGHQPGPCPAPSRALHLPRTRPGRCLLRATTASVVQRGLGRGASRGFVDLSAGAHPLGATSKPSRRPVTPVTSAHCGGWRNPADSPAGDASSGVSPAPSEALHVPRTRPRPCPPRATTVAVVRRPARGSVGHGDPSAGAHPPRMRLLFRGSAAHRRNGCPTTLWASSEERRGASSE